MRQSTYYVLNDHTLGYIIDNHPYSFNVLKGSVLKGGYDWKNGPVAYSPSDELKPATHDDFDRFNVRHQGHLPSRYAQEALF